MKTQTYHQINPLIRMKESELLTAKQYEQLLQADTQDELEDVLRHTVYGSYLSTHFFEDFESVHAKEQGKMYEWLYDLSPEAAVIEIYTSRFTFHNLKVLTKAEMLDQNLDHLLISDGRYAPDVLKSAIRTRVSSVLPQPFLAAIAEARAYLETTFVLPAIDIIYDRFFLAYQKELAQHLNHTDITEEVWSFIDLTNICTIARGILQGQNETFLSTIVASAGFLDQATLLAFSEQPLATFVAYLLTTRYSQLFENIAQPQTQTLDLVAFERAKDDYLSAIYDRAKVTAFGPLPLLAFLQAKETEWKNLRLLIVGKKNHFSTAQIKERMRNI